MKLHVLYRATNDIKCLVYLHAYRLTTLSVILAKIRVAKLRVYVLATYRFFIRNYSEP